MDECNAVRTSKEILHLNFKNIIIRDKINHHEKVIYYLVHYAGLHNDFV